MNCVTVSGRLGKDSELKYTPQGTAVLKFSIANNTGFGDKKRTNWFDVTLWGKQAESMSRWLLKGKDIDVVGELNIRDWTSENGKSGRAVEINAHSIGFRGGDNKDRAQHNEPEEQGASPEPAERPEPARTPSQLETTDIPF